MTSSPLFVEIECSQRVKTGQAACGDDFRCVRTDMDRRSIAVLSDGLGSGIKACLMARMTTTMAMDFVRSDMDILQSAETMMDALPVCEVRKISYATFTIFDMQLYGRTRVIEMGNPPYIHLRGQDDIAPDSSRKLVSARWSDRALTLSEITLAAGDRLVAFSDGVTQAGLGFPGSKFGWRREGALQYIRQLTAENSDISARELADRVATQAILRNPDRKCRDDISCMVLYLRYPRVLRLLTGPPYRRETDREFAAMARFPAGKVVICGGTTANIVARELGSSIAVDLRRLRQSGNLPPPNSMPDIGLVTEGILTLTQVAADLDAGRLRSAGAASQDIVDLMLNSDAIEFIVGTKVNDAHQDPSLPVDLEIRRNIIKRLQAILESRYRKRVSIRYY